MSKAPPPPDPIVLKIIDLIGAAAYEKLTRHGFVVVETTLVEKFKREHKASNDRIRETAAAAMRAIGIDAARVEPVYGADGEVARLIFTAPSIDEGRFARSVGDFVKDALFPTGAPEGAKRSDAPIYDTNDVGFHTPPASPDNLIDPVD